MSDQDRSRRVGIATEGHPSGQHLIQNNAQRVDIRARISDVGGCIRTRKRKAVTISANIAPATRINHGARRNQVEFCSEEFKSKVDMMITTP